MSDYCAVVNFYSQIFALGKEKDYYHDIGKMLKLLEFGFLVLSGSGVFLLYFRNMHMLR